MPPRLCCLVRCSDLLRDSHFPQKKKARNFAGFRFFPTDERAEALPSDEDLLLLNEFHGDVDRRATAADRVELGIFDDLGDARHDLGREPRPT